MGRRILRKTDPSIELAGHLTTLDALDVPFQNRNLFAQESPLEVEVGSGKGLFLMSASAANPERNYLGIEISRKYARFAAARLAKAKVKNAVVVHGDAQRFFADILLDESVAAAHIYFPDPWWKKRHRKRRVINAPFLVQVQRKLQIDATLQFWTDVQEYFQSAVEMIKSTTQLEGPVDVCPEPAEHDLDYRTHFERRMRLRGIPVYRAVFRKTSATASTDFSLDEP